MHWSAETAGAALAEIEDVYRREVGRFVRVAAAITGNGEDGWEAVQDAVARVVRGRAGFRGEGSLEAWMWTAVVNAARSKRREATRELSSDIQPEEKGWSPEPEAREAVRRAVSGLPERQRLVLFLRYYADLSYEEIAAVVGMSSGTVGPTLASAQTSLRQLLGGDQA